VPRPVPKVVCVLLVALLCDVCLSVVFTTGDFGGAFQARFVTSPAADGISQSTETDTARSGALARLLGGRTTARSNGASPAIVPTLSPSVVGRFGTSLSADRSTRLQSGAGLSLAIRGPPAADLIS
jgi:hypothetical protein